MTITVSSDKIMCELEEESLDIVKSVKRNILE